MNRTNPLQCMESFKAVEKEMKTKAFSKEGLSQNTKQDPREKERDDLCDYLNEKLEEINQVLTEELEAEAASLQVTMKKKQKNNANAERLAEIETVQDRYKWHEGRIQLLLRSLQNGNVENQQVLDIKSDIEEVVKDGKEPDFDGDAYEGIYDDLNLDSEEAQYGLANENDRISSQDAHSIPGDPPEPEPVQIPVKKVRSEPPAATRRPSTQLKSPLPALASLNTMPPPPPIPKDLNMKPAPLPTTSTLKYASAAAAAAASDKAGVGISPLPPPPVNLSGGQSSPALTKASLSQSPASVTAQPVEKAPTPVSVSRPASVSAPISTPASVPTSIPTAAVVEEPVPIEPSPLRTKSPSLSSSSAPAPSQTNSVPPTPAMEKTEAVAEPMIADEMPATNGDVQEEVESIYHLPPGLQDLLDSFENTKSRSIQQPAQLSRILQAAQDNCPEPTDLDRPQHYRPTHKYATPAHYPQDILPMFDDPALYENQRMETDTLFYIFYYKQGSYQQYLAAKALKNQSWRFHKQYQTWFQRHEEPKSITEEYEQGTYRFFDYESTWYV